MPHRWGRGSQALHYFGDQVHVETKECNSHFVHTLDSDQDVWLAAYRSDSGRQYETPMYTVRK